MAEKLAYADEHLRWALGLLLLEPRGHKDLFGAILVPPCSPEADFGLIFMDNQKFEPMCGHAVIGTVTTLLETGMFEMVEPETLMTLDTPAGLVRTHAKIKGGKVESVSFENVPSFVFRTDLTLQVPDVGDLVVDIAFGGLFFVLVNARQLEITLIPDNLPRLADIGMRIISAANQQVTVRHPELPHIDEIMDVRFYEEPDSPEVESRNVVILGDNMVDRSPCGTGTCAETALRFTRGKISLDEAFTTESILGTRFTAQAVAETQVGSGSEVFPAVIPKVTGSAYITGFHQFVLDDDDPFQEGFILRT
jgi:proline racemase